MAVYRLPAMKWESVNESLRSQVVHGDRMTVTHYAFTDGGVFGDHIHEQEQITMVLRGTLEMTLEGVSYVLHPGELIVIPPGAAHRAEAGQGETRVISIVSPARQGADGITYV